MALIVTANGSASHTGSTIEGPVNSSLDSSTPWLKISGYAAFVPGDIDTPSHAYDTGDFGPIYHSHPNQSCPASGPEYIKANDAKFAELGDGNTEHDTYITSIGQSFVTIN